MVLQRPFNILHFKSVRHDVKLLARVLNKKGEIGLRYRVENDDRFIRNRDRQANRELTRTRDARET